MEVRGLELTQNWKVAQREHLKKMEVGDYMGENYFINQGRVNQWNKLLVYSSFQYRCALLFCFFVREWKMLAGTWDPAQEFSMHGLRL